MRLAAHASFKRKFNSRTEKIDTRLAVAELSRLNESRFEPDYT